MTAYSDNNPILRPGDTCWSIAKADQLAVIVDAAAYFAILREVVAKAKRSVVFIGWDFDTRIELEPDAEDQDKPNLLGRFLEWVVEQSPDLQVHVLKWDIGLLKTLARGTTPLMLANLMSHQRIQMKMDSAHPSGSAHHQKIVVIDDVLAFCGGIDITAERWDTRDHPDDDPRRKRPTSQREYGPWHDITTAVSGPAAKALGDIARDRWKTATGETLEVPEHMPPLWPSALRPMIEHVDVGLSRSLPEYEDRREVREIEALYLEIIRQTEKTLYIESQYFASRRIAEAMAARLSEPEGPEIFIVNPHAADGWLEEKVMGSARARLLDLVRRADTYDRFRLSTPVTAQGTHIYVHAKVVIMDDRLLRVGSSNLNNRSMGFDSECDLSLEATRGPQDADLRRAILDLRNDLLAEHLAVQPAEVEAAIAAENGSLVRAVDALRGSGRTLSEFTAPEFADLTKQTLAENDLLDPESASSSWFS
ncbi:phospholipase D-like domain-containing protein [Pseudoruegeria sp. SK021]|uniref:phospholipase D-like domain-containing protein n=1 Tax=Pseudoruegeria sp. SK021 TaxID=1933035 RepID=UPI000A221F7F|nr:phospholipase D-like domain-containing protein [Pseudoruegeria sp. SK021]OSP54055.1 phospholipase [Pseudoruegeria sp. SK021]